MPVDESFKRPGSVPFKWEIEPGIPKHAHQNSNLHQQPRKIRPPPAGIAYDPPNHGPLPVRIPASRSKSADRRRPSRNSPAVVSTGCFAMSSPSRRLERKSSFSKMDADDATIDISNLQTLSRWYLSPRKSLSPENGSLSPATPFRIPPVRDAEWAAYGLF